MNWQDDVARYYKTHRSPKEGVAGKMIAGADTGEADGTRQTIGDEGNPSMLAIPVGQHGGYSGCCHRVVLKESARMERISGTIEETVSIGTVSRVLEWLPSGCNGL